MLITMFYFFEKLYPVGVTPVEKRSLERETVSVPSNLLAPNCCIGSNPEEKSRFLRQGK